MTVLPAKSPAAPSRTYAPSLPRGSHQTRRDPGTRNGASCGKAPPWLCRSTAKNGEDDDAPIQELPWARASLTERWWNFVHGVENIEWTPFDPDAPRGDDGHKPDAPLGPGEVVPFKKRFRLQAQRPRRVSEGRAGASVRSKNLERRENEECGSEAAPELSRLGLTHHPKAQSRPAPTCATHRLGQGLMNRELS